MCSEQTRCHAAVTVTIQIDFSQIVIMFFILSTAEIYPKVYHTCFFIVTYFAPLCLMVLAYIQICHKLWFQQVCIPLLYVFKSRTWAVSSFWIVNWCSFGGFGWLICARLLNRFLEARQCCRGSGGPCSAQLRLRGQESPWGSGPALFVLRSNRSEPDARQLGCWWWSSLFLPCATCQSACSMSWRGNLSLWKKKSFKVCISFSHKEVLVWSWLTDTRCLKCFKLLLVFSFQTDRTTLKACKSALMLNWPRRTPPTESLGLSRPPMTERQCMHGSPSHTGSYMPTVQQILSSTISSAVSL